MGADSPRRRGSPGSGTPNISPPDYIRAVPTVDLPDDELAAVTAALRRVIEGDRYPHAPRLDPLRAALARLEAASADRTSFPKETRSGTDPKPTPDPKTPPAAKADKRARR
jgi:hypothetical protein